MNRLRLEELIVRRIVLSPREAATLTLAVAREWDRRRQLFAATVLPSAAAIEFHRSGRITFLNLAPAVHVDESAALSHLLSRLLGVDDGRVPWAPLRVESTRSTNGDSSPAEISTLDGHSFRSALLRFADEPAAVLPALFARVAAEVQRTAAPARRAGARTVVRPAKDRRHARVSATDLRREIRMLERQLFESQPTIGRRFLLWATRPSPGRSAAACVAILIVAATLAVTRVGSREASDAEPTHAAALQSIGNDIADVRLSAAGSPVAHVSSAPAADRRKAGTAPPTSHPGRRAAAKALPTRQSPRGARPAPPVRHASAPSVFAGGTRGVAWGMSR